MTWTDDNGRRMRLWIDREVGTIEDAQKFMDTLVNRTVGILNREPIDIYVNPTFLPNQLSARYDELWTAARMEQVVSALKANGVALEINNRYRIPSAAFIARARDAGVKFACGTNNAGASDLGRLQYCIEMIRACNLTWQHMWVPPAEGQKAIQRKPLPVSTQ
jgi:histidinol phosphatase-like PHP family hydrolase